MISPADALERLKDGNRRFVGEDSNNEDTIRQASRANLRGEQNPFAIVLSCSDSRVPVEMVFDQGFGDLFVIRVAGNIVAPSQIGSVEFAATNFGTRLVVVLGHSNCGAIIATLEELGKKEELRSPNLRAIVDRVRPAIEPLLDKYGKVDPHDAVVANVRCSVHGLQHGSQIIEELVGSGELRIVGAKYSLESGKVAFLSD